MIRVAGGTSTGSKHVGALFGGADAEMPARMTRAQGCRVWDATGRIFIDYIMGLGAVALGYGHPDVSRAAVAAVENGVVGPLAPVLEEEVATAITAAIPWVEQVRFLKSGAEAVAAAVRLARVHTGRDRVLGCGYHGWLDGCQQGSGIPAAVQELYAELPFNDAERTRELIRRAGDGLACVVFEPVIERAPDAAWLAVLREETERTGAVLIADEIKTVCRLDVGGAAARYGFRPDLVVIGKALANGFPLAAVGGSTAVMSGVARTWISSTLATEYVALAAAGATLRVIQSASVPAHLGRVGGRLLDGLHALGQRFPQAIDGVHGIAEMCFLRYADDVTSRSITRECARRGLLFKRTAYNFVSLAHDDALVDGTLGVLDEALTAFTRTG